MDFFSIADVVQQSIENDQKLNFKINIQRIKKPQFLNAFMSYSLNEKNTFFINKKLRRNARFLCVLRMFLWFLIKTENILQYKIEQQAIKNGSKIGRSQKWKPLQNRWIKNRTFQIFSTNADECNCFSTQFFKDTLTPRFHFMVDSASRKSRTFFKVAIHEVRNYDMVC